MKKYWKVINDQLKILDFGGHMWDGTFIPIKNNDQGETIYQINPYNFCQRDKNLKDIFSYFNDVQGLISSKKFGEQTNRKKSQEDFDMLCDKKVDMLGTDPWWNGCERFN